MPPRANLWVTQLKETCKTTGACWAVWLARLEGGWEFGYGHGLGKARQSMLLRFTQDSHIAAWMAGGLSGQRIRWRDTGAFTADLGCQRLFLFPNSTAHALLLVGADDLDKPSQAFFRILAMNAPTAGTPELPLDVQVPQWLLEASLESPYDTEEVLKNVLNFLADTLRCDAGYLAVRFGDMFRIQATRHCPPAVHGYDLSIHDDESLARIVASRQGLVVENASLEPGFALRIPLDKPVLSWLGAPIVIGQRVIGLAAFTASLPGMFTAADLKRIVHHTARLAYAVENAIMFAEAARYLQQLAMLNELASAASMGLDIAEVSQRVTQRLCRTFGAGRVGVFLLAPDGKTLREYGSEARKPTSLDETIQAGLVRDVITGGQSLRVGDVRALAADTAQDTGVRSGLAAPLKYRGQVIGAIALESIESNAFTAQDEQLLAVIASNLAGLIENVRLNEETRERARVLQDTVRQLQAVRETALEVAGDLDLDTLLQRVVHRARELVAARGAELGLLDAKEQIIHVLYSETPWNFDQGGKIPLMAGVAGQVAVFGEPLVVTDYNNWKGRLFPEKRAPFRTVAGVPLKFGGEIMGTLTVMDDRPEKVFHEEDVRLLELLAPQVAVSIRNARLYQELQERIEAQRLAENRLLLSARLAAVGEMAAGVAHELNNPLTTVTGFVELVLEDLPVGSTAHEDLTLVLKESQRARSVVRRLLDFARPLEDQRVRADLNKLASETLELVNHLIRTHGVATRLEFQDSLPWIMVDPNQIKQVLLNLIHNALHAMPTGGELCIETALIQRDGRKWVTFAVVDTGEGIAPKHIDRIFEPFFTTRPAGAGTGLGLSISYGIITDHGGYIDVESQVGQGSRFTVYLPVESESADG